jgi:hypothetical protein
MTALVPPMPVLSAVDPTSGVVIIDLPCRQCGYNVRGLSPAGACPECGARVALSLRGDLLRYSQPQWLRKLQRGVELILWNIVLAILAAIALAVLTRIAGTSGGLIGQLITLAAALVGFVGAWWLTEPDPSGLGEDQYGTVRKLIRITLMLGAIQAVFGLVLALAGPLPPWARMTTDAVNIVFQIAAVVGVIATLQYLRRLSMRIPDLDIANRSKFLMYTLGICYAMLILVGIVILVLIGSGGVAGGGGAASAMMGVGCFAALVGVAMLVFGVMYLFMLIRLRRRFVEQATLAEQVWQQPPPGNAPPPTPMAVPPL